MSNEDRNQPPGVSLQDIPPMSAGNPRGLIPVLVERLDVVRNQILDYDDGDYDRIWEATRVGIDRELRSIQMELAALCPNG